METVNILRKGCRHVGARLYYVVRYQLRLRPGTGPDSRAEALVAGFGK